MAVSGATCGTGAAGTCWPAARDPADTRVSAAAPRMDRAFTIPSTPLVRGAFQFALEQPPKLGPLRGRQILDGVIERPRVHVHPRGVRVFELHAGGRRREHRPDLRVDRI